MLVSLAFALSAASLVCSAAVKPRQAINPYNDGTPRRDGNANEGLRAVAPPVYNAREIDLPFYRLYHGEIEFFKQGQTNNPANWTNNWVDAGGVDDPKQSACGIPNNAYYTANVAIHPYFLKYAPLDRYCQPDVCIALWREQGGADMMFKVTDICPTDECPTPADIKIDRAKAAVLEGLNLPGMPNIEGTPSLHGDKFPLGGYWHFMKCWADGVVQDPYKNNAFAQPFLDSNLPWAQQAAFDQMMNNQKAYPAKGWPQYPNGGYNPEHDDIIAPPISDWVPGQEPCYTPINGGLGIGNKICGAGSTQASSSNTTASPSISSSTSSLAAAAAGTFTPAADTTISKTKFNAVQPQNVSQSFDTPQDEPQDDCDAEL